MTERLAISRLGHRGDGIADTPAGQVFVPYTLPGETVTVEPVPGHPDRGHLLHVERASPERIAPPCQHFGVCGGCALQHWDLEKQLLWKRELVVEALRSVGLDPPVAATVDAHGEGRRRVTLHARRSSGGILEVGFAAPRAHHVVAIDRCPILTRDLEGAIEAAWAIAEIMKPVGKPLDIQATATANGLDIDVRGSGALDTRLRSALARLADAHSLARITRHGELVIQRIPPTLTVGPAAVTLPAGVFLQATAAAEKILSDLVRAGVGRAKHVADLFCGIGPFALRLAQKSRVTAADSDAPAVAALKAAATNAPGLKPLDAVTRDLFRRPFVASELRTFDAVVFDPPRQGAEAQARELARSIVAKVVAVSCNSATFARDARILVDGGYRLETVTPVDQFRYSAHIEIVGVFTKRDEKTRSVLSR